MIYEDIFSVPIFQKAYKSYRTSLFEKVTFTKFPVKGRFRCRVVVGRWKIWFVQTITPVKSPH